MTAFQFFHLAGREPRNDDLDRVNCPFAGSMGHHYCGVCHHRIPRFLCVECFEPFALWQKRADCHKASESER